MFMVSIKLNLEWVRIAFPQTKLLGMSNAPNVTFPICSLNVYSVVYNELQSVKHRGYVRTRPQSTCFPVQRFSTSSAVTKH